MNVWKESLEQNKAAKVRDQLIIMLGLTVLSKLQNHIGFTWHLKIVIVMITSQKSFGEVLILKQFLLLWEEEITQEMHLNMLFAHI